MEREVDKRKIYISTMSTDYVIRGESIHNPQFSMEWLLNLKNNTSKANLVPVFELFDKLVIPVLKDLKHLKELFYNVHIA